jgi:phosphate transport system ATP-binding protein
VNIDPMQNAWSDSSDEIRHETVLAQFPRAALVQVVSGDAHRADAVVEELLGADVTVTVTDGRIVAAHGDMSWAWLLTDVAAVIHGADGRWTIFDVPGISDFGVAFDGQSAAEFRHVLDELPALDIRHQAAPAMVVGTTSFPPRPPGGSQPVPDFAAPLPPIVVSEPQPLSNHHTPVPGDHPSGLAGLDARNVSAWFGTHLVLDRVSLHMEAGKVTALIGPSGCGKSTFLRILNRMHEMIPAAAMAGEVLLDGHDIYDADRKLTDARREVGMVFQKPNPFPAMSIYDNVLASFRLTGTKAPTDVKDEVVETCLSKAGLWNEVKDRLRQPGGGLSGGQQQRLCIARALAIKPRVLLMDEPCSALDPTSTRRIEETIIELVSEVTIVIVTHNMQQAARVSDHCAFFLASQGTPGVIVEHGATDAMFSSPRDGRTLDYVSGRFG